MRPPWFFSVIAMRSASLCCVWIRSRLAATRRTSSQNRRVHFVKARNIDWIGAEGNYARLHVGIREYELRETLTSLERRLNPIDFLRIHRSTIVNVHRIKEIQRWFRGHHLVLLENGQELRMSRYQPEIRRRLGLP